jgi:Glycosyl transferase family 2
VDSIRRYYPRIAVLVVDDSREPLDQVAKGITRYLHEPYNSLGSGPGRNFALRQAETEYVLFSDDDMVFGRRTDLAEMLRALETTHFDVVSCTWIDHDPSTGVTLGPRRFEGTLDLVDGTLVHRFGQARGEIDGLPVFDIVHQFFVARRDRLGENPWDPRMTPLDHTECFLRLKERGLLCTRLEDVVVDHRPLRPDSYWAVRGDTEHALRLWQDTRGFDRREFHGSQFRPLDRVRYRWPSTAAWMARRAGRRLSRASVALVAAAALAFVPVATAATMIMGKGIDPWKLGQRYVQRPGVVRVERHPENNRPGCSLGPRSASRIEWYRGLRLSWRGLGADKGLHLIDVATTRQGDRTGDGLTVGRSRLAAVRRARPNGTLSYSVDRYRLGRTLLTVVRSTGEESWISMLFWFDRRDVLVALETGESGC